MDCKYSKTCLNDHLYINTTCLQGPHFTGPRGVLSMLLNLHIKTTCVHVYKDYILLVPSVVFIYNFHCITHPHISLYNQYTCTCILKTYAVQSSKSPHLKQNGAKKTAGSTFHI